MGLALVCCSLIILQQLMLNPQAPGLQTSVTIPWMPHYFQSPVKSRASISSMIHGFWDPRSGNQFDDSWVSTGIRVSCPGSHKEGWILWGFKRVLTGTAAT